MQFFDIYSLILYIAVALVGCICLQRANTTIVAFDKLRILNESFYYLLFILIFTFIAVYRRIDLGIGGTDAPDYIENFTHIFEYSSRFQEQEQLFLYLNRFVRTFTDDYHVFFFICYSFIAFSYVYFLKNFYSPKSSYIPLLLLIIPFLRSFSSLRSSLAISLFLIGLVLFLVKQKRNWGILFIIATFWIHRMSILYIAFVPFYYIFRYRIVKLRGKKLFLFFLIFLVGGYLSSKFLQNYVLAMQFFYSETDAWYLSRSLDMSLMSRWPMMINYILLLSAIFYLHKRIPSTDRMNNLKILVSYDILVMLPSLIFGMWRANEYLYLARLAMWGVLIKVFLDHFKPILRPFLRVVIFVLFLSWLIFRIYQDYAELSIMPYMFDF